MFFIQFFLQVAAEVLGSIVLFELLRRHLCYIGDSSFPTTSPLVQAHRGSSFLLIFSKQNRHPFILSIRKSDRIHPPIKSLLSPGSSSF